MDIRFSVVFGPIEDLTPEVIDELLAQLLACMPDNGPVISVDTDAAVEIVVTVDQDEPLTIGHLQSSPVEEVGVGIGKAMAEAGFRQSPPILRVTEPVPADERELALA